MKSLPLSFQKLWHFLHGGNDSSRSPDRVNRLSWETNFKIIKKAFLPLTAQKMKFSTKDFFNKCDQIRNGKLRFLCSVWTLNYVDCIHLSCFDSFRMAHKPNNLRKFILEFLKNMIKLPSSCRGSYDCLNNPCLSLHLSVTHFSQDLLSGFSQFFGWEYFVILKWQIQILENWIYGLDKSLNEKNSDQKQNIWHFSENNIIIVL